MEPAADINDSLTRISAGSLGDVDFLGGSLVGSTSLGWVMVVKNGSEGIVSVIHGPTRRQEHSDQHDDEACPDECSHFFPPFPESGCQGRHSPTEEATPPLVNRLPEGPGKVTCPF